MHPCLCVDEILRLVAHEIVAANQNATAVALARCCKSFEDPMLDALWGTMPEFTNLLETLPRDIWGPCGYKSFRRFPTMQEWARLRAYARRMRIVQGYDILDPLSLQVLSVLQSNAFKEPLLPNLQTLRMWITTRTEELMPFVPLLLSTKTTLIDLTLSGYDVYKAEIASMVTSLPTLCPNLNRIRFVGLPRDSMITDAVSELVLRIGRNDLQYFDADSPLTAEAREVIYKHPNLSTLQAVFDGPTTLPTIALPNLTSIDIESCYGHDWLQGFCGASLGKLTSVSIFSDSDPTDEFLEAFKAVALTTSIPATLSKFSYSTEHPWRPSYRSLLPFTQLTGLVIESTCEFECSSTIDDDIITDLARAMPRLELLHLGGSPCETPAGVTVKGLAALAYHCSHLFNLGIHFQVASLDPAVIPSLTSKPNESTIPREYCPLHFLQAGRIRVPEESVSKVASALVQIFPHLKEIESSDMRWREVSSIIHRCRQLARVFAVFRSITDHTSTVRRAHSLSTA